MKLSELANSKERQDFLKRKLNIELDAITLALSDEEDSIHCENLIGATTIPLGVAGPVMVKGEFTEGEYYLPLATTEGALIASVNRGCKAVNAGGGVDVLVHKVGTTRGPVFYVGSLENHKKLKSWIHNNKEELIQIAKETSSHLSLIKIKTQGTADYLFVRFYFDTQDAMGMNMVTIATTKIVEYVEKETGIGCLSVAGNFDIDKKPAWLNFINNRGFCSWAEAVIPADTVKKVLKTDSQKIFDVWLAKCMIGSIMSGSLGFNSHYANIIAAIFASTGQDMAHVVEGSMGITTAKALPNGDLYISVYLPALMIGTVGGGTALKIKKEALNILRVKKSVEMAEVVTAAVLCGELSLLASLAQGSLAKVHSRLGR